MMVCRTLSRCISAAPILCVVMILGIGGVVPLSAQTNEANLSGIVSDSSGSVIPGATVNLIDTTRGITRTAVSNETGAYQFPFVQPGTYDIEATLDGFKTLRREGLVLSAAQSARINLTLEVGGLTETVTVDASAGPLNTGVGSNQ